MTIAAAWGIIEGQKGKRAQENLLRFAQRVGAWAVQAQEPSEARLAARYAARAAGKIILASQYEA